MDCFDIRMLRRNSPAATYYVAPAGDDARTGTGSWTNAVRTISNGVAKALWAGGVVLVSNGTYDITADIYIARAITLRGLNRADTIIQGDYPSTTNRGIQVNHYDAVVENFTITNCGDTNTGFYGGGVRITKGRLNNSIVSGNTADRGGGVALFNNAVMSNCLVLGNTATNTGGGVYVENSGGKVLNSTIADNVAFSAGGAYLHVELLTVNPEVTVRNSTICSNTAYGTLGGGGLYCYRGGTAVNCLVYGNISSNYGGGVYMPVRGTVDSCTVVSNYSKSSGGGIFVQAGTAETSRMHVNNTISVSNTTGHLGADLYTANYSWFTNNCIFNVYGTVVGTNNLIATDPLFVDPTSGNYRLRPDSPCIHAGTNLPWMSEPNAVDFDGYPRIDRVVRRVDMGCYEYIPVGAFFHLR